MQTITYPTVTDYDTDELEQIIGQQPVDTIVNLALNARTEVLRLAAVRTLIVLLQYESEGFSDWNLKQLTRGLKDTTGENLNLFHAVLELQQARKEAEQQAYEDSLADMSAWDVKVMRYDWQED